MFFSWDFRFLLGCGFGLQPSATEKIASPEPELIEEFSLLAFNRYSFIFFFFFSFFYIRLFSFLEWQLMAQVRWQNHVRHREGDGHQPSTYLRSCFQGDINVDSSWLGFMLKKLMIRLKFNQHEHKINWYVSVWTHSGFVHLTSEWTMPGHPGT